MQQVNDAWADRQKGQPDVRAAHLLLTQAQSGLQRRSDHALTHVAHCCVFLPSHRPHQPGTQVRMLAADELHVDGPRCAELRLCWICNCGVRLEGSTFNAGVCCA